MFFSSKTFLVLCLAFLRIIFSSIFVYVVLACYIEIDEDDDEGCVVDENESQSNWGDLPNLLLEEIFSYLDIKSRYYASLVCRNWYDGYYFPKVWRTFQVGDDTLCRYKYNYYSGWTPVLDHHRVQNCLFRIGRLIKGLEFVPYNNFNNMNQFMSILVFFIKQREAGTYEYWQIGKRITSFRYKFPCNMTLSETDMKLFGTGGAMLKTLKALLFELRTLKSLKLIDLMLERYEAKHLLDEVLESCSVTLKTLCLINVTNTHCPIMHCGLFFNLQVLIISPQNLDDDVLQLLASTQLRHLHILQNNYCPTTPAACHAKAWKMFRLENPGIKVHLRLESSSPNAQLTYQPNAPVHSITFCTPKERMSNEKLVQIVDMYKFTLTTYGYELLPRFTCPKSFHNRIDSMLLLMSRQCPNLTSLQIREKVSTATLLLIAKTAINLRFFHVRRNAIILRCEWPKHPEWSDDFYEWLKASSRTYEATEKEISQILGYHWSMLSDRNFKNTKIQLSGFSVWFL